MGLPILVMLWNDPHNNVTYILQNLEAFTSKMWFQNNFNVIWLIESNIHAPVFFDLLNLLQKSNKMLDKPRILSLFSNLFNKLNNTWALMLDVSLKIENLALSHILWFFVSFFSAVHMCR